MRITASAVLYIATSVSGTKAFTSRIARRAFGTSGILKAATTDTMIENPLLEQDGLPKFESIEPKHLTPAVESLLDKLEKDFTSLEESFGDSPEYDQVLPEVERMQFGLGYTWGVCSLEKNYNIYFCLFKYSICSGCILTVLT